MIGPGSISLLKTRLPDHREHNFGTKEGTVAAIIFECRRQGLVYPNQIAYILATVEHETNKTFQPVIEAYWLSDEWRRTHLRYFPYYGRGYVQLTWRENYRKYGEILGVPLEQKPDLALEPSVALFVLVHGLKTGTFTGRKISDYIDHSRVDYFRARRCVNGMDKAAEIAGLARDWAKRII
jgi:predicted chitinase